ncbi:MAG: hypothetical protein ACRDH2_20490, partial [Anaerolineales bacterium]
KAAGQLPVAIATPSGQQSYSPIPALIQQTGGLPKSSVEILPGANVPTSTPVYPVTTWKIVRMRVSDNQPLWNSIRDDDPTFGVEMDIQVQYADGNQGILRWRTWRYGLLICPLVIAYGDGPPGRIELVDLSTR